MREKGEAKDDEREGERGKGWIREKGETKDAEGEGMDGREGGEAKDIRGKKRKVERRDGRGGGLSFSSAPLA